MKRLIARAVVIGMAVLAATWGTLVPHVRVGAQSAGGAEEAFAGPPVLINWSTLRRVPQFAQLVAPRLSDLDQRELDRLKQRPSVPPTAPTIQLSEDRPRHALPTEVRSRAPDLLTGFQGPTQADNQAAGFLARPPDPDLAVGPNHVGVVVNQLFTIYSKTGAKLSQTTLASWFASVCLGCSPFDPRLTYDPQEGHWILVALHLEPGASRILLSVSAGPDPLASTWYTWSLDGLLVYPPTGETTWADYPDVGFDGIRSMVAPSGAIYITTNQFTFGNVFRTAVLYILPKSTLYTGGSSLTYWRAWDRLNSDGSHAATLRAAKMYGNPGVEFLINSRQNGNFASVWRVTPSYPPAPVDWTLQATITIGAYAVPPNAPQAGCSDLIDTIDNRMYNAVWQGNRIYSAFAHAFDWGTPGTVESAIRYLKINTLTNTAEINAVFGQDNTFYFMPAVAVDGAQRLMIVFARSSSTEFAGVHYTGHRAGAATAEPRAQLMAGTQCITSGTDPATRWGDYFGGAVDPAATYKVWIFGEWAANIPTVVGADWDWGTWIGQVHFAPTFADVSETDLGYRWVEEVYYRGITSGCTISPLNFCPDDPVTRSQMAVFMIRAKGLMPVSPCTGIFSDVPVTDPNCGYIEQTYNQGITAGCFFDPTTGERRYCPNNNVTRGQMGVFLNRAIGATSCDTCPQDFADVPTTHPFFGWIERLYQRAVTAGCATAPLLYCPNDIVNRRQMAILLIRNFFP